MNNSLSQPDLVVEAVGSAWFGHVYALDEDNYSNGPLVTTIPSSPAMGLEMALSQALMA